MLFNLHAIKEEYKQQKSPTRELSKYLFSVGTLGLGALWFWATTIVIKQGEIGVREDSKGNIILLPPGRHSNFPWESYPAPVQSLSNKNISLGSYKIITVETGYVAKTINKGILKILTEGQHLLIDAAHTFSGYIPVKQETKQLGNVAAYTQDNVGISLDADVRYQITDPAKTISSVQDVEQSIKEIAQMQLSAVIGRHNLNELIPAASGLKQKTNNEATSKEHGLSMVVHELMQNIEALFKDLGIKLINIGIKSWSIIDKSLAHELGQGAVIKSQTTSKLLTANSDAEILIIKAAAQANSQRTIAKGISDAADLLANNPFAQQLALSDKQIQLVAAANSGTNLFYGSNNGNQPSFFYNTPSTVNQRTLKINHKKIVPTTQETPESTKDITL